MKVSYARIFDPENVSFKEGLNSFGFQVIFFVIIKSLLLLSIRFRCRLIFDAWKLGENDAISLKQRQQSTSMGFLYIWPNNDSILGFPFYCFESSNCTIFITVPSVVLSDKVRCVRPTVLSLNAKLENFRNKSFIYKIKKKKNRISPFKRFLHISIPHSLSTLQITHSLFLSTTVDLVFVLLTKLEPFGIGKWYVHFLKSSRIIFYIQNVSFFCFLFSLKRINATYYWHEKSNTCHCFTISILRWHASEATNRELFISYKMEWMPIDVLSTWWIYVVREVLQYLIDILVDKKLYAIELFTRLKIRSTEIFLSFLFHAFVTNVKIIVTFLVDTF